MPRTIEDRIAAALACRVRLSYERNGEREDEAALADMISLVRELKAALVEIKGCTGEHGGAAKALRIIDVALKQ